jgi:hypothetical protein
MVQCLIDFGCYRILTAAGWHHFKYSYHVFQAQPLFCCTSQFLSPFFRAEFGFAGLQSASRRAVGVSQSNVVRHQTSASPRPHNSDPKPSGLWQVRNCIISYFVFSQQIPSDTAIGGQYLVSLIHICFVAGFGDQIVPHGCFTLLSCIRRDMIFKI